MRYRSILVFCLGGWSPLLPTRFHVSRGTLDTTPCMQDFEYRTVTFFGRAFQRISSIPFALVGSPQPRCGFPLRFGLFPVRSPLLRESRFDYFSSGYLDVSVPQVPSSYSMVWVTEHNFCQVPPFGNLRVKGCLHLSVAYRSLPRPSSASIAKASTVRP